MFVKKKKIIYNMFMFPPVSVIMDSDSEFYLDVTRVYSLPNTAAATELSRP